MSAALARAAEGARARGGARRWPIAASLVGALVVYLVGGQARADVVDETFARGNAAAARGDWAAAAASYEEAGRLLPGRSAALSYNLGTAYAQLGELGPATLHLRRALQPAAEPSVEIAEAARRNLGLVRQRMEVAAAAEGAQIDRPEGWWELLLAAVRAPLFGWLALLAGWSALAVLGLRMRLAGRGGALTASSLASVLAIVFVAIGGLHGLSLRGEQVTPQAIVLPTTAEVREAPGAHRRRAFLVQGGSRVRVIARTAGWSQIRLGGGLEGWVPEATLGALAATSSR